MLSKRFPSITTCATLAIPPTFMVGPDYAPARAPDSKYAAIGESERMTLKFVKAAAATAP